MEQLFAAPWYWVIAGVVLMGFEILLPGVFLLWIGLGALVVGMVLLAVPDLTLGGQLLLFAASMLTSIGTGFWVQRHGRSEQHERPLNQELQGLVGRRLAAASDFAQGRGRVRVGDTTYAAQCDAPVAAGDTVRVTAIESGRLQVVREGTDRPKEGASTSSDTGTGSDSGTGTETGTDAIAGGPVRAHDPDH